MCEREIVNVCSELEKGVGDPYKYIASKMAIVHL